jgi:hypothetical protein
MITKRKDSRHKFWDGLRRGIKLTSILYKIDIVAGFHKFPREMMNHFETGVARL